MKPITILMSMSVLLIAGCGVAAETPVVTPPTFKIPPVITTYFDRLDNVYKSESTEDDISLFLDLMTDDVRYIHYDYEADFDLPTWRKAFSRIHKNGGYSKSQTFCTAITNSIAGNNAHAIEYAVGDMSGGMCVPEKSERMLVVFKLDGEKITRIEELW